MKNCLVIWMILLPLGLQAQSPPASRYADECRRMVEEGDRLAASKEKDNYKKALAKYNAAKACDDALTGEVNEKILALFEAIENEKNEAVRQRARAEKQTRIANEQARLSRAQYLAAQAQLAYDAADKIGGEAPGAADLDRGILLALESLNTLPTLEGDLVLRNGLRKIATNRFEIPLDKGTNLLGIGPQGEWLFIQTEKGPRIVDVVSRVEREPTPMEIQSISIKSEDASINLPPGISEDFFAISADKKWVLVTSNGEWAPSSPDKWFSLVNMEVRRVSDGKMVALLSHEWYLMYAHFSLDNQWLVTVTGSVSIDAAEPSATVLVGSTVRVWDVLNWQIVSEMSLAQEGGIEKVLSSQEKDWIATVVQSPDGRIVLLWPLWPALLREEACKTLTRNLSRSEWDLFLKEQSYRETCPGLPMVSE